MVAFVAVMATMKGTAALHVPPPASVAPALKATRVVEESGAGAVVVQVADCGAVVSAEVV